MRRHLTALCITLGLGILGLGTLSACAQSAGSVDAGSSAPAVSTAPSSSVAPSPSSAATPSPSGSMTPPIIVQPPAPSASGGATISLSGQIYSGAEPTCLLLKQGDVQYLLLASDSMKLRVGLRAVVTGHVVTGIMTHCQQGKPFEVTGIDPLAP